MTIFTQLGLRLGLVWLVWVRFRFVCLIRFDSVSFKSSVDISKRVEHQSGFRRYWIPVESVSRGPTLVVFEMFKNVYKYVLNFKYTWLSVVMRKALEQSTRKKAQSSPFSDRQRIKTAFRLLGDLLKRQNRFIQSFLFTLIQSFLLTNTSSVWVVIYGFAISVCKLPRYTRQLLNWWKAVIQ